MIRTRDFFLFLCTVFFLAAGIGATVVRDIRPGSSQLGSAVVGFSAAEPVEREAEVITSPGIDRPSLLSKMREKLAASGITFGSASDDDEAAADEPAPVDEEPAVVLEEPLHCSNYGEVSRLGFSGARFKEVEGARLIYREGPSVTVTPDETATGTAMLPPVSSDEILLQLPLRTNPLPAPTCLPYDVVGIALDGSLMRNDEMALYSVFGGETLIGYALDGFPLYGVRDDVVTDTCGGVVVGGMYRYYLSSERETLISCFSGEPVAL
jgi:hypothetical protein